MALRMRPQVSYAEEAVQQGALAVTASNGRDTIVMCLARGDNEGTSEPEGTDSGGIGGDSDDDVKASEVRGVHGIRSCGTLDGRFRARHPHRIAVLLMRPSRS